MPTRIHLSYWRMMNALDGTGGNKAAAAARLGVSPATLRREMLAEGMNDYIWFPTIKRRILARHEIDVALAALLSGHFPSQKRILDEADRERVTNEPQLMSEAEVRDFPDALRRMAAELPQPVNDANESER